MLPHGTKATLLLKENVFALLRVRKLSNKDLAQYCRRSESWISKIHRTAGKGFPLKYLDRIADLIGLEPYQLLQPGIAGFAERRHVSRRHGKERRLGPARVVTAVGQSPLKTQATLGKDEHGPEDGRQIPADAAALQSESLGKLRAGLDEILDQLQALTRTLAGDDRSLPSPRPRKTGSRRVAP